MGYRLRTRFAPTPSGYLHLGNAWSFVLTWLAARSQGGSIHLRIDDLDADRFRDEYLEDIFASLLWLGLDYDSGPRNAAEFKAAHSQRHRIHRYQKALEVLAEKKSVYACECSREKIRRAVGDSGVYPGICRDRGLEFGSTTLRYRIPDGTVRVRDESGGAFALRPDRDMGDFGVRQKNGDPSYQLASVVDDEDMGINFVVRGLDLMPSTGAQLSLSSALGCEGFSQARFWHHDLVLDDAGKKLSKSENAESLRSLRERFSNPAPLYRFFARYLGADPEKVVSASDLLSGFAMERVSKRPLRLQDFLREGGG